MMDSVSLINAERVTVIVNHGVSSKIFKIIKSHGILGGISFGANGTVNSKLLEFFNLTDIRKEVVMFVGPSEVCRAALKDLYETLHLEKPNHGIAFCMALTGVVSSKGRYKGNESNELQSEGTTMYTNIMVTVDKGKAESVMDAAVAAGARGGTIINARGSGINQTSMLFSMEIEPEKEIILILVKDDIAEKVIEEISKEMNIEEPGNGVIFTQKVLRTYGILDS
jgi:Nitrogen regulatory protein PII